MDSSELGWPCRVRFSEIKETLRKRECIKAEQSLHEVGKGTEPGHLQRFAAVCLSSLPNNGRGAQSMKSDESASSSWKLTSCIKVRNTKGLKPSVTQRKQAGKYPHGQGRWLIKPSC